MVRSCSICKESKPLTPEFFHRSKNKTGGFDYRCKTCKNKKSIKYQSDNKEKVNARRKQRREENKEEFLQKRRDYHSKNKDSINKRVREYRSENKDKFIQLQKNYNDKSKLKLDDRYIKNLVRSDHQEIIKTKRLILQIKRELK